MEKLAKYGEEFIFHIPLVTFGETGYQINPTLALGDAQISKDGGAFTNITLPVVTPSGSRSIKVVLSATQMQAKQILIQFVDAAGDEWEADVFILSTYGHTDAQHPYIGEGLFDRVLDSSTHNVNKSAGKRIRGIEEYQGYEGGKIYIDTTGGGSAGSEDYVNGTLDNAVDNLPDAILLSASLGIHCFDVASGSSLTFVSSQDGRCFEGHSWTLALGGQSINGLYVHGSDVSGIATATTTSPSFHDCSINGTTLPPGHYHFCGFTGNMIAGAPGDYFFVDCSSAVAGTATPSFDYGPAIGNTNFNFRSYHGGMEIKNMGQTGTDNCSFDGDGQIIINANSIGGTIRIAGHQALTGSADFITAGGIISDDARFAADQLVGLVTVTGGGGTTTPSYAEEGEPLNIVQGNVINIPRYITGDQSAKTIFSAAKLATGDTSYVIDVIQCTVGAYDADDDQTSYLIPFAANDTKTVTPGTYKGESEVRDADGTSNPVTGDRFDLNVIGEIIT